MNEKKVSCTTPIQQTILHMVTMRKSNSLTSHRAAGWHLDNKQKRWKYKASIIKAITLVSHKFKSYKENTPDDTHCPIDQKALPDQS